MVDNFGRMNEPTDFRTKRATFSRLLRAESGSAEDGREVAMTGRWMTVFCALTTLAWVGGCADTQMIDASSGAPRRVDPAVELIARYQPYIPDVPVPVGFKLDQAKSRDYTFGAGRFVDHVYKGRDDKMAVKRFYERQMPINRWELTTTMFVVGDVVMDFEKETERCRVAVDDSGGIVNRTCVKIRVWTSGPIPSRVAAADKRPKK